MEDGIAMLQDGGFYYVIGYGQNLDVPAIDIISREISFIGNLVGTYADLEDLMTLSAQGRSASRRARSTRSTTRSPLDEGRLHGRDILLPAGGG